MESPRELAGLKKLRELFVGEVEKRGGRVHAFAISPTDSPEAHALIELDDHLFADEEQQKVNNEFAELEARLREETLTEQGVDAIKQLAQLEERLKDPENGLLEDPDV